MTTIRRLLDLAACHLPPIGLIIAGILDELKGRNHAYQDDE